jgi:lipopolysaccharide transport system ATP-binding protein
MSRPIIEVENVSKRYRLGQFNATTLREEVEQFFQRFRKNGNANDVVNAPNGSEFWALKDVSFSVQPGEVIGIVGRNGAGKSTLLKILSRVTEPSSGEARIRGRVASLLEVGTGFHPELTGRENVYLNGTILGMTKTEVKAKFDEIVAFAEVEKFLDTPVKRYSSGMYVRLAFAVAAHLEPEILVVDEVLAVGDAEFQKKCLGKMQEVSGEHGRTVLFVSHNLAAIRALTQKTLFLKSGATRFFGPTPTAIEAYLEEMTDRSHQPSSAQGKGHHTRVLSVRVLDSNGSPTENYSSDSPLILDVTIETDGAKGLSFDVYVVNSLGQRVYFYTSNLFDEIDIPSAKGCYRGKIAFKPLLLASGNYSIDFATAVTNVGYDNYVSTAATFRIPYFNPTGSSWDFRESDGYGSVAMSLSEPLSLRQV